MSATQKSGVISGLEKKVTKKAVDVASLILSGKRGDNKLALKTLDQALQGFVDDLHFKVIILKPKTFGQFLKLEKPTQSIFNQLASEVSWWDLLNQIEETCFFNKSMIEKARPFIVDLWKDEVAQNPFQPSKDWKYLRIEDAVIAYQHFLGSNLKLDSTLDIARKLKPCSESEGIAVWPKLSTLARIFDISGNPLEDTKQGRKAYAKIVELFIPKVDEAYTKAYPKFYFRNWQEGKFTVDYVRLTSAGRKTWQRLEQTTKDDFVIAPATTGKIYAGYSVRRSRIEIILFGNQLPQDYIMVGSTIVIQPNRLTRVRHLSIDCPGSFYSPDVDGDFSFCLCFHWSGGELEFGCRRANHANQVFGSASAFE